MHNFKRFLWIGLLVCLLASLFLVTACDDDDDDDDNDDATPPGDDDTGDDDTGDDDATPPGDPFEDVPIDQTIALENLTGTVDVIEDEYGIPHIYATNKSDLSQVLGYISARLRLFQMDMLRHYTTGRLSEYFSFLALDTDVETRATFMSTNGQMVYERIPELLTDDQRTWAQAYCNGVNAFLNDIRLGANGAMLPPEYSEFLMAIIGMNAEKIPDWTLEDIFALARYQQYDLSYTQSDELWNAMMFASVPADVLADTLRFAPATDTVILPDFYSDKSAKDPAPLVVPEHIRQLDFDRLRRAFNRSGISGEEHRLGDTLGSNNWTLSGDVTATGKPMLANDPHLGHMNPSVFYEVQLDTSLYGDGDGFSAYGMAFPGIPAIMIGMNENIAWGVTVVGYDVEDLYIETLNLFEDKVKFNGDWVDIAYSEQQFRLGPGEDAFAITKQLPYVPHHGAFLYGSVEDSGGLTQRWTGHEPSNDLPAFLDLLWAEDIDDFFVAVNQFATGAQNFVAIDTSGNIGYYPHAKVPIRDNASLAVPPYAPLPGEGDHEWTGYIADESLPQANNPDVGYVFTANNDVVGNLLDNNPMNDTYYLYSDTAVGFRAKRIENLMAANLGSIDHDTMLTIQNDTFSLEGERFLPHLLNAATDRPDLVTDLGLSDALARLEDWDFSTPAAVEGDMVTVPISEDDLTNSVACTLFYTWFTRLRYAVLADEFATYGDGSLLPGRSAIWYLLENADTSQTGDDLFDDIGTVGVETREEIMLQTLANAIDWCASANGFNTADMSQWQWGKIHKTQWEDFYGSLGLSQDTKGPYPVDGADYTVDPAGSHGVDDFINYNGPATRWSVHVGDEGMVARSVIPGGNSGVRTSPYYNDQAILYLNNETHESHFAATDVADHATYRIRFTP